MNLTTPALLSNRMFDAWLAAIESRSKKAFRRTERIDNALFAVTEAFWDVCCPEVTTRTLGGPLPPAPLRDIWWAAVVTSAANTPGATLLVPSYGTQGSRRRPTAHDETRTSDV